MRFPVLLSAAFLLVATAARADSINYIFNINGNGISSTGTLTISSTADPNVSQVTGISGVFTSTAGNFSGSITGLSPASYSASSPTNGGGFIYDNLFYRTGASATCYGTTTNALVDNCGIDFLVNNIYEVNLYYQPGSGYVVADALASSNTSYYDNNVVVAFTAAQTPEVPSVWLLVTGIAGVALYGLRRRMASLKRHEAQQADPLAVTV